MRNKIYINGIYFGSVDIWNYQELSNCLKLN